MKKIVIGALVGGIVLFLWQAISNSVLNLHSDALRFTPKQDSILHLLSTQLDHEGTYFLPNLPVTASHEEYQKLDQFSKGQPWAVIAFHKSYQANLYMNMIRTLIIDILIVLFVCLILERVPNRRTGIILLISLSVGAIVFLNGFYIQYIWYQNAGLKADLIETMIGWGLCGLWLGRWFKNV